MMVQTAVRCQARYIDDSELDGMDAAGRGDGMAVEEERFFRIAGALEGVGFKRVAGP